VYNTVVTLGLPRWCSWLHWSRLTPFTWVVRNGSPYGVLEGRYNNTCCNYGKVHSYAAANTFYPPKKICFESCEHSLLIIWLQGHFRPIYLEEITKMEAVLIYSSQFWYFWWPCSGPYRLVMFLLKICIWSIPLHIIVPLIPPNHQFRVPSVAEIGLFWNKSLLEKKGNFCKAWNPKLMVG